MAKKALDWEKAKGDHVYTVSAVEEIIRSFFLE